MGLFSHSKKVNPKIVVDGLDVEYRTDFEQWAFVYRGTEFCSFEQSLILPSKTDLDTIVGSLEALKPEMQARIKKYMADWDHVKHDDGETCFVDIKDFAADKSFVVFWSDGASWGDLGVDFTIRDNVIIDEIWGD
jgi:hypothetical protein